MSKPARAENRKHPRFKTRIPIRFNLNPDYHLVPEIKKIGVGGIAGNISREAVMIDSRMDLLDVCQIFHEAIEDDSALEIEVFITEPSGRMEVMRGSMRWCELSNPESNIRHFQAGLHLNEAESRAVATLIVESLPSR